MQNKNVVHVDFQSNDCEGDHPICKVCEVRACGMCSELSSENVNELRKFTRTKEYKAGDVIFCDEEPTENYATIKNGIVKLSKILPDGRQQTIGLGFPPDLLAEPLKIKMRPLPVRLLM